jgi:hypothetical protein|tara:strand:- start:75 stop:518 length:444 start_codon:yes stop_codon:yes gene_type:complete
MSFLTTHRRNIIDTLTINKNQIEPGDIVEFRYKSKKGNNLEIVLALNNITKDSEKKLHAIKLENMSLPLFKRLLNEIGNPVLTTDTRKNKEITKVILEGDTETERQGFYTNTLKKFTRENIYRTYLEKNITSVKLVEYNFKNKQLGF